MSAAWVAVAETARGHAKSSKAARRRRAAALLGVLALIPPVALAQVASVVVAPGSNLNAYVAPNGVTVVNINQANAAGLSHNQFQSFNVNPIGLILNNTTSAQIAWQSQLAGQVTANFNQTNAARVILNEVVSNNRSTLAGFTEVLGSRADVVLANPYGITCSGCGFINTDRVTLTTGLPFMRADGSLGGFNVSQGDILVTGAGLNATAQQVLDLVTRSVRLEGNVNAQDFGVFAGTNRWDYGTRAVAGSADAKGPAPVYAIDSSALGGMYANRIKLVATEAGVGVRMRGDAAASAEDFMLSSAGGVEMRGRISAQRDVLVASTSNDAAAVALVEGTLTAARDIAVTTGSGGLALARGVILAGNDLKASGARIDAGQGSRLQAGRALEASATAGDLALGAAAVRAEGDLHLATTGTLSTASGEGQGVQSMNGNVAIDAAGGLTNAGVITADKGHLTLRAGVQLSNSGTLNAGVVLDIADRAGGGSQSIVNSGSLIAAQSMTTRAAGIDNTGWMQAGGTNALDAANLRNSGKIVAVKGGATLNVAQTLDNTGSVRAEQDITIAGRNGDAVRQLNNSGDLLAGRAMDVRAAALVNAASGWVQAATGSTVEAATLDNAGTWLLSQQAGGLDQVRVAGNLVNAGVMQSAGDVRLSAHTLDNRNALVANGRLEAATAGTLANASGAILQAGQTLALTSGGALVNGADATITGRSVELTVAQGIDNDGVVTARSGGTRLRADGTIDNSGKIHAAGLLDIADRSGAAGETVVNSGVLVGGEALLLKGDAVRNLSGARVEAGRTSTVEAASLHNQGTWLLSTQGGGATSEVRVRDTLTNAGTMQAAQDAAIIASRLDNQTSALLRTGGRLEATLGGSQALGNAGTIQAGAGQGGSTAALKITAAHGRIDNASTGVLLGDQLAISADSIVNSGAIQGGGSAASSVETAGTFTNQADAVLTMGTTETSGGTLAAAGIANHGTLQSLGGLTLAIGTGGLQSRTNGRAGNGDIVANGPLTLQARAGGDYTANIDGTLQSKSGALVVRGGGNSVFALEGNALGKTVKVDIGGVRIGASAALSSQEDLDLDASRLSLAVRGTGSNAVTGRILGATSRTGKATLDITQAFTNDGLLFSGNDLEINAPSITNSAATGGIAALNNLTIKANAGWLDLSAASPSAGAGNLDNLGSLYAGGTLAATANGTLLNRGTINAGSKIDLKAHTLVNNTEINSDGDIAIVASRLRNEVQGGDTRVWIDGPVTYDGKDGGVYKDSPGAFENLDFGQDYRKDWTRVFGFRPGTAPTVTPQITAGKAIKLEFHEGKNLGGLIYAAQGIDMEGFADANGNRATFVNDSLATRTEHWTTRWTMHRKEAGQAGGAEIYGWSLCTGERYDSICTFDGYKTVKGRVDSTQVPGLNAGIYTKDLTGRNFLLSNQGGAFDAQLGDAKSGTSATRGGVSNNSPTTGPGGAISRDTAGAAGAAAAVGFAGGRSAGTVSGISFLDANAANGVRGTSFGGIDITLPGNPNGFFVIARAPGARYLVESNPLYMAGGATVGSDYLSRLLGYNADEIGLRLGDASYEAWLVKQQLIKQTGNAVLASYAGADTQMQGLMENAATQSASLGLVYGKALTPEQQAGLQQDIVWMVQTEIDGKNVLAPVVYLSQSTKGKIVAGAVISAQDANLSLNALTNSGGTLIASRSLVVASTGDISNLSGLIKGGDVSLSSSQGSIVNKTLSEGSGSEQFYRTVIGKTAGIESTGTLSLDAKKDITNVGATVKAGTDARLKAGGNVNFDTIENKTTDTVAGDLRIDGVDGRTKTTTTTVQQVKSGLTAGGNLSIDAGKNITLAGTDTQAAGNADLKAGGDLNLIARENSTTTHTESKASGFGMNNSLYGSTTVTSDSTSVRNVGSTLQVGGNASLAAKNDLTVQGSSVDVTGSGTLSATHVNVLAGRNYDETHTTTKQSGILQVSASGGGAANSQASAQAGAGRGLAAGGAQGSAEATGQGAAGLAFNSSTTTQTDTTDLKHVASTLNFGGDLAVNASKDVTLQGSTVNAGGNAQVNAQNVNLLAAEDKSTSSTTTTRTTVGLMASTDNKVAANASVDESASGGNGRAPNAKAGAQAEVSASSDNRIDLVQHSKTTRETLDTTHQGSAITAKGNLGIKAADTLALEGSNLAAGGDLNIAAKDMQFKAVDDVHETRTSSDTTTAGLYATGNAKASANAGAAGGLGAQAGASAKASAAGEVGLYGSNTRTGSVEGATTAVTSGLSAGGNISRVADNAITDVGTRIEGGGNLTQSAKTITSLAAADTTYASSSTDTNTAKIGVYAEASAGVSAQAAAGPGATKPTQRSKTVGAGARASYELDQASEQSASSTAVVSTIRMGGSVNSVSSGSTTLEGTNIAAGKDVTLGASRLDYTAAHNTSSASSKSTSAGATVGVDVMNKEVSVGVDYAGSNSSQSTRTAVVGGIQAGGDVKVTTTGDARFEGTNVVAVGAAGVATGGKLSFDAAKNTTASNSESNSVAVEVAAGKSGAAGSGGVSHERSKSASSEDVAGSIRSGSGPLTITSGGDATFTGTALASQGDVAVGAGGNLAFNAAHKTQSSESVKVGVSSAVSAGAKTMGATDAAGTGNAQSTTTTGATAPASGGKKSGGKEMNQRSGEGSLGVGKGEAKSDTATGGNITSGGRVRLSSGKDTTLEGTQVKAATGIAADAGGTFTQKDAVSTASSSNPGFTADAAGTTVSPKKAPAGKAGAGSTPTSGNAGAKPAATPPAPTKPLPPIPARGAKPATTTPSTTTGAVKPPTRPLPPIPAGATKPATTTPSTTTGAAKPPTRPLPPIPAGAATSSAASPPKTTAGATPPAGATPATPGTKQPSVPPILEQKKGSAVVDVYVDNQQSSSGQATTLDGGSGGIVINQGRPAPKGPKTDAGAPP
ncbi:hypothetical protein ASD34_24560 [Variovorax sp. Root473]|nr:hypothetical protein ASD34_24560 [Variovorax sp. Root473]